MRKGGTLGGDQLVDMWVKMLDHAKCTSEGSCSHLDFFHSVPHSFSFLFISSLLLISSSSD